MIRTDNSTVVSYLNRQGGTHFHSICLLTWKLLSWCIPLHISLQAIHLAGNKNVIADALFTGTISPHRMDSPSPNITTSIQYPGQPPHRSLCNRCPQHRLDEHIGLRLSPNIFADKSCNKDRERKMQNYPHCSGSPDFSTSLALYCSQNDQTSFSNPCRGCYTQTRRVFICQPGCYQTHPSTGRPF